MTDPRALYRSVLRIRRIEEAVAARYGEQQMRCPVHLAIGQEAVAAGVCAAMQPQDGVFGGHRAHAPYLAKGGDLTAMIAEMYGLAAGCSRGVGGSMHMIDLAAGFLGAVPIVGATLPLAVGAAWAARLQGQDKVIAVFFGDGTFEEGVMHESLNFAVLHSLPVLFVCENNGYSCYTPLAARQPARPIHGIAAAHGCTALTADGNDAAAVFATAAPAIEALRAGGRPVFLECPTYRWLEHCGHSDDDHLGYRPAGELARWQQNCPLARAEAAVRALPDGDAFIERAEAEVAAEIAAAFAAALASPPPRVEDLPGYVYA